MWKVISKHSLIFSKVATPNIRKFLTKGLVRIGIRKIVGNYKNNYWQNYEMKSKWKKISNII